ncbi:MAG: tRNA-(ms[2]io[6]A)-hydroxylase [Pseudomonadota bacterium]
MPDAPLAVPVLPAAGFVGCPTPAAWLDAAARQLELLLIDHANCEKKAASTALNLLFRHVDRPELLATLSQLAREELLHFEQVVALMQERGIVYRQIGAGRYAAELRRHVRAEEPGRLVDTLIVGAFIEARSCERFAALAPRLDDGLARYYRFLLRSEERHYADYLELARRYAGDPEAFAARVAFFREAERALIESPDPEFRFHSGVPAAG